MGIQTRPINYEHNGTSLEGILAIDDNTKTPAPVVLISHAWAGRTDFEIGAAKKLAELGYAAIAIDLYGKGVSGATPEECEKLMTPFMKDRALLQSRLLHTIDVVKDLIETDANNVAAIGFCFGGLCVLDIARTGVDIKGVASFHGLLGAPSNTADKINAKIVAFHGWDDPMATPEDIVALGKELTAAKADWQLHAYGQTMHAFTNPAANDPGFGTVYSKTAAARSWQSLTMFLEECFQ